MELELIVKKLSLKNHPEGGFFAESYRSLDQLNASSLFPWNGEKDATRSISTAIYYLLAGADFSAFHKIKSDECWHFYLGASFEIIEITLNQPPPVLPPFFSVTSRCRQLERSLYESP